MPVSTISSSTLLGFPTLFNSEFNIFHFILNYVNYLYYLERLIAQCICR
uniref:Uncharacterized protein n=1 Tax=Lepeophtheirus salmonis TaxID=72036 RepID=A0A0K2U495_LEPSM